MDDKLVLNTMFIARRTAFFYWPGEKWRLGISVARAFEYWIKASQTAGPIQWTGEVLEDPEAAD